MSEVHTKDRLRQYYTDMAGVFEAMSGNNGHYNLGWLPPGSLRSFREGQRELVRVATDRLEVAAGARVLDIGSGRGAPARFMAGQRRLEVMALDRLQEQVRMAHTGDTDQLVTWLNGDAAMLPLVENSFDGALCLESAFHYPDRTAFLREAHRVLRPGARLVIGDILIRERYDSHPFHDGYRRALASPGLWTLSRYRRELETAGFAPLMAHDLTPGVVRSLHNAAPDVRRLWTPLRHKGYAASYLAALWMGFMVMPLLGRRLPATYHLLVGCKND